MFKNLNLDMIKDQINTFLVKLWDSFKQKNAKTATAVVIIIGAIWALAILILSIPTLEAMLPVVAINIIKSAISIVGFILTALTGSRTFTDITNIKKEELKVEEAPVQDLPVVEQLVVGNPVIEIEKSKAPKSVKNGIYEIKTGVWEQLDETKAIHHDSSAALKSGKESFEKYYKNKNKNKK